MWLFRFFYSSLRLDVRQLETDVYYLKKENEVLRGIIDDIYKRLSSHDKRFNVLNDRMDSCENLYYSLDEVF